MSLPPGFLDDLRSRTSLAQVVARKVTWEARKTNAGKGDYWAPCPFHQEKTASFHVDDKKGFYYCFGCHAKGDALSFVRETENVGFMDAVEILAREVGLPMPARDPQAQQKADERTRLAEIMEQAVKFYRLQLKTGAASEARAYLERRGLPETTLDRFEIGFAPDTRTGLFQHLTGKGVGADDIVTAGLCIRPDDGGQPYDRFRGRIMFPIRDARGRATAFGGRAMDPNARAKYLNSNETPLFDKGRSLYNHGPAREASGKSGKLIVAEGYMDVIALSQAGFEHAVAPLGTAITSDQLQLMWRISDEPVIALDGDTAGLRAAMRLIDIALPMLSAGKSLRFCLLPEGQDPDDLIKTSGAKAMSAVLDAARPMVDLLWQRETEGKVFDSPERRAGLDASLKTALSKIEDGSVCNHYEAAIRELRRDLFRPAQRAQQGKRTAWTPRGAPQGPTPSAKGSLLAQGQAQSEARVRESVILACCLNHPDLIPQIEGDLERLRFLCPDLAILRDALLSCATELLDSDHKDSAAPLERLVADRMGQDPMDKLNGIGQVRTAAPIQKGGDPAMALLTLQEEIAKQMFSLGLAAEIEDAVEELSGIADEGVTWRLQQASETREKLARDGVEKTSGGSEDTKDLSKRLQDMLDGQVWLRKKK